MTDRRACPTHPRYPVDACPRCEQRIDELEDERLRPNPEASDREARAYEDWLDRCGEGG
jgi:hypothetical protein